ncbi:uncharacterized protein EI90DRAFT_2314408 [Cantharellus anzutake]|uniref:uncharacterized protein n=1 Tax=Cantharellus anzutake TaxID=1750568 RepID=UPI001908649D|nr:uncharacterized protein EI90DRAFT_2314408 [Cantharellus anzutake]KAF8339986.1 hypothetical protein EI90DRAFT_2314408 [Cantharellus anzutake]
MPVVSRLKLSGSTRAFGCFPCRVKKCRCPMQDGDQVCGNCHVHNFTCEGYGVERRGWTRDHRFITWVREVLMKRKCRTRPKKVLHTGTPNSTGGQLEDVLPGGKHADTAPTHVRFDAEVDSSANNSVTSSQIALPCPMEHNVVPGVGPNIPPYPNVISQREHLPQYQAMGGYHPQLTGDPSLSPCNGTMLSASDVGSAITSCIPHTHHVGYDGVQHEQSNHHQQIISQSTSPGHQYLGELVYHILKMMFPSQDPTGDQVRTAMDIIWRVSQGDLPQQIMG